MEVVTLEQSNGIVLSGSGIQYLGAENVQGD